MAATPKLTRTAAIRLVFGILVGIVIINLFVIQIVRHQEYVEAARAEHMRQFTIKAKRGQIYAMDGEERVPIVMNRQVWTVFLDPMSVGDVGVYKEKLSGILGDEILGVIDAGMEDRSLRYYVIAREVGREQAEAIKALQFAGVGLSEETRRAYVEEGMAGQLLGFVNNEGEGQYGVEGGFDEVLAGEDGYMNTVTDVNLIPLSLGDENVAVPAVDGEDITLSIDRNIQRAVEKILETRVSGSVADKGSAIVMDAKDGRVVAMANYPSYNPDRYREVEDAYVFQNPVLEDPYEPGSVIKTFAFAAGVDIGRLNAQTPWTNTPYVTIDGYKIGNVVQGYYGNITMQEAFNRSLNTGSVAALKMFDGDGSVITYRAREILHDYYANMGLGQDSKTGVYEAVGTLIAPDDPSGEGNNIRYANMTFGQGLAVNMLQMSAAMSAVVNGGEYHAPYLVTEHRAESATRVLRAETSEEMRKMIVGVWSHLNRYNRYNIVNSDKVTVGGKTGTAEVAGADGKYKEDETIGSFVGFVGSGIDNAEYVVMARVSGDGESLGGWEDAAPIFADIVNYVIKYKGIGG